MILNLSTDMLFVLPLFIKNCNEIYTSLNNTVFINKYVHQYLFLFLWINFILNQNCLRNW